MAKVLILWPVVRQACLGAGGSRQEGDACSAEIKFYKKQKDCDTFLKNFHSCSAVLKPPFLKTLLLAFSSSASCRILVYY
jgi:hypothetical protein